MMLARNMLLSAVLALSLCSKGNPQRLSRPTPIPFQLLGLGGSAVKNCRMGKADQCYYGCPISCENVMDLPTYCRDESCKRKECACLSGYIEKSTSDRACIPVRNCRKGRWTSWTVWSSCSKTCGKGVRRRRRQCSRGGVCVGSIDGIRGCHIGSCRGSAPCDRIGCEPDATCSPGSDVDCICNKGFKKDNSAEDVCKKLTPCDKNPCHAQARCENVGAYHFICTCNKGYEGNGTICKRPTTIEKNPCNPNPCDLNAWCRNAPRGQFICTCKAGFTGNGRTCKPIEPCDSSPCDSNAWCRNAPRGQFICTCKTGFTGNGRTCKPIEPCDSSPCDSNAWCRNAPRGQFICTCKTGFTGNGRTCKPIEPCDSSPCDSNAWCRNAPRGQYTCTCKAGFTGNGRTCVTPIEPCDSNPCDQNAWCRIAPRGKFICTCKAGFTGNGRTCEPIQPCDSNPCDPNAICADAPAGQYICTCKEGFTGDGETCTSCKDASWCASMDKRLCETYPFVESSCKTFCGICDPEILPCDSNPCDPNATCLNEPRGQYSCRCNSGYTGDGRTCIEILPCDSSPCDPNASCRNRPRSQYSCRCNSGYTGDGRTCKEILPCDSDPCDPKASCRNMPRGQYICRCNSGYSGDGRTCIEISLCDSTPCDPNASCEDANGEFVICRCKEGYTGDGWKCESVSCDEPSWCSRLQDFCVSNRVIMESCPTTCQGCLAGHIFPDNGIWGIWTAWGLCDVTCGDGLQRRTRKCSKGQGACVGSSAETKECDPTPPPCQGTWDPWTDWGRCGVKCGGGAHERTRTCQGLGTCAGRAFESKDCNTNQCEWTTWTRWSECDVTCGDGTRSRLRSCAEPGQCAGESTKTRKCVKEACEGTWDPWSSWGDCDVTCDEGEMVRTRKCQGPLICVGEASETRKCNLSPCQEQGKWDPWMKWSRCNTDCESKRSRLCLGSGGCVGAASETRTCKTGSCQGWSECSKTCGGGERSRKRCIFASLCSTTYKDCNTQTCEPGSGLCETNPCKNGGVCEQSDSSYNCVCPPGFAGRNCDQKTHPCDEKPCRNGGDCKKSGFEYACVCKPRYSGMHCEDECKGEWTSWFDRDNPSGGGDYEDLSLIRKDFPLKACITPSVIDARVVKSQTHWTKSGDVISATTDGGLTCKNEEQKPGRICKDYEVRFCCPKIDDRKEVELVAKNFRRAILSVAAAGKKGLVAWSSWTEDEDCDRRVLDSSSRSRIIGRGCPSRRTKRETGDDQEIKNRDVLFLIDESVSVGHTYFKKFRRLVQAILTYFCGDIDIGEDKTRVSVMTFDFGQHPHISFNDFYRKEELLQAIGNIEYNRSTAGFTCLADGLAYAKDGMFQTSQGARLDDDKTEQVVYLLSDGCTYCRPKVDSVAELLDVTVKLSERDISIITFLVGTHSDECINELESLIDGTRCHQTFSFTSWDEVDLAIDGFETTDCASSWESTDLNSCNDPIVEDDV